MQSAKEEIYLNGVQRGDRHWPTISKHKIRTTQRFFSEKKSFRKDYDFKDSSFEEEYLNCLER